MMQYFQTLPNTKVVVCWLTVTVNVNSCLYAWQHMLEWDSYVYMIVKTTAEVCANRCCFNNITIDWQQKKNDISIN